MRSVILALCLAFVFSFPAFAEEAPEATEVPAASSEEVLPEVTPALEETPAPTVAPDLSEDPVQADVNTVEEVVVDEPTNTTIDLSVSLVDESDDVTVTSVLDAAPAADGFVAQITALLGTYQPRTETVTVTNSDGSTSTYTQIVPGLAGMDWPWIGAYTLFCLVVYCFLRIVGGVLRG